MQRVSSVSSTNPNLINLIHLSSPQRLQIFNLIHLCDAPSNTGALRDSASGADNDNPAQ